MKSLAIILGAFLALPILAADTIKPPTAKQVSEALPGTATAFSAGTVSLETFGTYRAHAFDGKVERFGAGAGLEYFLVENISAEPYFVSEGLQLQGAPFADSFTDAGLNFRGYLPLAKSGFAAYGLIGYSHGFGRDAKWQVYGEDKFLAAKGRDGDDRMAGGVGICLRGSGKFLGLVPGAFADGVWLNNFEHPGHALFRLGLSGSF